MHRFLKQHDTTLAAADCALTRELKAWHSSTSSWGNQLDVTAVRVRNISTIGRNCVERGATAAKGLLKNRIKKITLN